MSSKKKPKPSPAMQKIQDIATPQKQITDPAAIAKAELKTQEDEARRVAIQGNETADQIAAREAQTLKNPRRARPRGQRALLSDANLGIGYGGGKTNLG
jgi:hypothetical protein